MKQTQSELIKKTDKLIKVETDVENISEKLEGNSSKHAALVNIVKLKQSRETL